MGKLPEDYDEMNDYQKGYAEGLSYEQEGPVGKKLDAALEFVMPTYRRKGKTKTGFEQGVSDMKKAKGGKKMAKGGSVSSRGDGCAVKGKTKGRII